MTDESTINPEQAQRLKLMERLMGFARLVQGLSQRFEGTAKWLTLTGLGSAVLLDSLMARGFSWSMTVTLIVGVILILPGLVVGWGWYVLNEAVNLPQRLLDFCAKAKDYAGDVTQHLKTPKVDRTERSGLKDLKKLGGLAFDMASFGLDSQELLLIMGGSLSLANPIYLLALSISIGAIGLISLAAAIALLLALF